MRTVTALGIAISARGRAPVSSLLIAVGTVAGFWLVQGIIAGALLLGTIFFLFPFATVEVAMTQQVFCTPLVFLIVAAVTVYGFYSIAQTWALRRAERFAARLD
jgi:hypothetical protein